MNWSYNYRAGGAACQVVDVRVSLHTNQFLPAFAPSPSTPARLGDTWQRYTASLQTHENGHVAIDTDYAQRLTTALQALTAPDCNQLARVAQTTTESYVAMLDTANALYDSQTNHGATQGAVL
jgi:predicted secreted Zn-dependent protease